MERNRLGDWKGESNSQKNGLKECADEFKWLELTSSEVFMIAVESLCSVTIYKQLSIIRGRINRFAN
jgi:hypothetical protein